MGKPAPESLNTESGIGSSGTGINQSLACKGGEFCNGASVDCSPEQYNSLRNEMTAWFQRISVIYSFSTAAIIAILGFQLSNSDPSKGDNIIRVLSQVLSFAFLYFFSYYTIKLLGRTSSLIARQGSYIKVYYEKGKGWITRNRAFGDRIDNYKNNAKNKEERDEVEKVYWTKAGTNSESSFLRAIAITALVISGILCIIVIQRIITKLTNLCDICWQCLLSVGLFLVIILVIVNFWRITSIYLKEYGDIWTKLWEKFKEEEEENKRGKSGSA